MTKKNEKTTKVNTELVTVNSAAKSSEQVIADRLKDTNVAPGVHRVASIMEVHEFINTNDLKATVTDLPNGKTVIETTLPTSMIVTPLKMLRKARTDKAEDFQHFTDDIRERGIRQPLIVKLVHDGQTFHAELFDGLQRLTAANIIGLATVPVSIDQSASMIDSIGMNAQRFETSHAEYCAAIREMLLNGEFSYAEATRKLHLPVAKIDKYIGVLSLPNDIQAKLKAGEISLASALVALTAKKSQVLKDEQKEEIYRKVVSGETADKIKEEVAREIDTTKAMKQMQGDADLSGKPVEYVHRAEYSRKRFDTGYGIMRALVDQKEVDGEELTSEEKAVWNVYLDCMQSLPCDIENGRKLWDEKHKTK